MLRSSLLLLLSVMGVLGGVAWVAALPPQCSPDILEDIDNPKIREICHFLQTYAEAVEAQGYAKGMHYSLSCPTMSSGLFV